MEGNGSGVGTSNYQSLILTLLLPVCYEASIQTLSVSISASGQVGDGAGWSRVGGVKRWHLPLPASGRSYAGEDA